MSTSTARSGASARSRRSPSSPCGVGQVEVEQRAVVAGEAGAGRLGQRAHAAELDLRAGELELLLDDQRVAVVVLDEQDAHARGCGRASDASTAREL